LWTVQAVSTIWGLYIGKTIHLLIALTEEIKSEVISSEQKIGDISSEIPVGTGRWLHKVFLSCLKEIRGEKLLVQNMFYYGTLAIQMYQYATLVPVKMGLQNLSTNRKKLWKVQILLYKLLLLNMTS
jgi:hypothetical protein